ncbi:MAG: alpha/beta hydrolase [Candidatus Eisenbacteria bacterium]|nr:alpha/beta hydrolase [Candidatus Eisenbacteria bacterium]
MHALRSTLLALAALLVSAAPLSAASAPAPGPVSAYFEARGLRTYYELRGSGSPLLLLHGGAGNGKQFEHQVGAFEREHRLIVPDCCCQGRTTCREDSLTYHAMAEDMIALLDHLGVKQVDVMGWSDGGDIGLDLAMHHPDRIRRLVTFGANLDPTGLNEPDQRWAATATPDSLGPGMRAGWIELAPDSTRYVDAMTRVLALWRTQPRWTTADLGRIRARVLVCAGEHDLIRRDHTESIARAIPGAKLWIVPGASHGAMLEKPELVNPRVLRFLAEK